MSETCYPINPALGDQGSAVWGSCIGGVCVPKARYHITDNV